ncbi:MAG: serine hydroxymethyltransferase [Selenomonadaceae bacterium]|nr:serine hydroxymethyltransferase [Selenomonadaceae bacterium]
MSDKKILQRIKNFDPELYKVLENALRRQISTLSLIPTDSAASPFSAYLKGSALGNDFIDYKSAEHHSSLERIAVKRACELFNAEHAIVRLGTSAAASSVVLQAFAKPDDDILSFNNRKSEYCKGDAMDFNFIKYSLEPDTFSLNFDKLRSLAMLCEPKIIIYSPVNYPKIIDYSELRKIADKVNSILWIDLGQNVGLVAAKKVPSPVKFADVVTFAANDALHGPQTSIILCKKKYAALLDQKVMETGQVSLKKNVLAALAVTFAEAACEAYEDYSEQVIENARALEDGLKKSGADIICSPTQNHLVIVRADNAKDVADKLAQANLLVKPEIFMTSDKNISYSVLRLSTLDPTTRSLKEKDLYKVGQMIGKFLHSAQDTAAIYEIGKVIRKMVENQPLFSDEWLPDAEAAQDVDSDLLMTAMVHWRL